MNKYINKMRLKNEIYTIMLDYEGEILQCNEAFIQDLNFKEDNVVGKNIGDIIDEDYLLIFLSKIKEAQEMPHHLSMQIMPFKDAFQNIQLVLGYVYGKIDAYGKRTYCVYGIPVKKRALKEDIRRDESIEEDYCFDNLDKKYCLRKILKLTQSGIIVYHVEMDTFETCRTHSLFLNISYESLKAFNESIYPYMNDKKDYRVLEYIEKGLYEDLPREKKIFHFHNGQGEEYYIEFQIQVIKDKAGNVINVVLFYTDVTERKKYEEKLNYLAFYDGHTQLKNRAKFEDEINNYHLQYNLNIVKEDLSIILLSVDNLVMISNVIGHQMHPYLIKMIGKRISSVLSPQDVLYKFEGDVFVIMKKKGESNLETIHLMHKLQEAFEENFKLKEHTLRLRICGGYCYFPEHGSTPNDLIKHCQMALDCSHYEGNHKIVIFEEWMEAKVLFRSKIEQFMEQAFINKDFYVEYQPKISTMNDHIIGFEALLRWSGSNEEISVNDFIPVIEKSRMIVPIGLWVLEESLIFLKAYNQRNQCHCKMAVNVSVAQMFQDDFIKDVKEILNRVKISPQLLEIEVTETMFIDDYDMVLDKIQTLSNMGIQIAIDDFGKGYSSLAHLMNLPFSTLKIDKTFIDQIGINEKIDNIIDFMIKLGHQLDLVVVAEGVEKESQYQFLKNQYCDIIQGYYFSKALPSDILLEKIEVDCFRISGI